MEIGSASVFGAASEAGKDSTKLATDFDDFLTLLTTQLQNQDPLDPMDSSQFTQQLVAFTGVEQQIQTNQNLETLADLSRLNNIGGIASYLGNEALIEAPFGDHTTDGIEWQYSNSQPTDSVVLRVLTESGGTVYEEAGETGLGIQEFNWDGYTTSGQLADPGNYRLEVVALDDSGNSLTPGIAVRETITAVDTSGIEPLFTIGPNTVGQTEILQLVYGRQR
jgi:flagellar basal-body rod modification protein FlgD